MTRRKTDGDLLNVKDISDIIKAKYQNMSRSKLVDMSKRGMLPEPERVIQEKNRTVRLYRKEVIEKWIVEAKPWERCAYDNEEQTFWRLKNKQLSDLFFKITTNRQVMTNE